MISGQRVTVREPCPECGGTNVYDSYDKVKALVMCPDCGHTGMAHRQPEGGNRR